jgi:succinoglycan biosynthesis transport protein ExoP
METVQSSRITSTNQQANSNPAVSTGSSDGFDSTIQKGINFYPLIRTIRRNAILILGVTALATGFAYWRSISKPPTYQGNFRLLVEPATPEESRTDPGAVIRGDDARPDLDYDTQIEILRSSEILSDIIARIQLQYPDFGRADLVRNLSIARCCSSDGIGGGRNTDTRIIEVLYQGSDPELVNLVLNTTADRFLQYSLEERKSSISEGVEFIDEQLPFLEARVSSLQSQIQDIQERYFITDPNGQGGELSAQLTTLSQQKLEAERLLQEQITLYNNLQNQLGLTPRQAVVSSTLSEDPGYQNLLRQREEIESQIALESALYTENSPVIQSLRAQEQEISELQFRRAREVVGSAFEGQVESQMLTYQNSIRTALIQQMVDAINQIEVLQARNNVLDQARAELNQRAQQFPAIARQYAELQRQLDLATQTLDTLLTQRETLRVEAAQREFPWDLISVSEVARDENDVPISIESNLPRNLALGLLAGLVAGTGSAVLLEKAKDRFYSLEDLGDGVSWPILGSIPYNPITHTDSLDLFSPQNQGVEYNQRDSSSLYSFHEAFSNLYTKIRLSTPSSSSQSILIASAEMQDGKSTVAFYLAKAAATAGQKVLLVDANFQAPRVHSMLGLEQSSGLSELLKGDQNFEDFIKPTSLSENLYAMTLGSSLTTPSTTLASSQMKDLVHKLHAAFDMVIYDTSDFQSTSSASFLASYGVETLFVVTLNQTSRTDVKDTLDEMDSFNLPSLGIVANNNKLGQRQDLI